MEVHVLNTLDIIMLISLFSIVTLHHYMTSYSNVDHVLTLLNDMTHAPDPVAYAPNPLIVCVSRPVRKTSLISHTYVS